MKRWATIFGIVFLAMGIAGFIPALCPNGLLFGIFAVDAMHNIVHIASGLLALGMAAAGEGAARNYVRIVGVVYGLVTVMGFIAGRDGMVMGMAMNMADHFLHLGLTAVLLWLGFFWHRDLPARGAGPDLRGA